MACLSESDFAKSLQRPGYMCSVNLWGAFGVVPLLLSYLWESCVSQLKPFLAHFYTPISHIVSCVSVLSKVGENGLLTQKSPLKNADRYPGCSENTMIQFLYFWVLLFLLGRLEENEFLMLITRVTF